jgi:hypothetical protein
MRAMIAAAAVSLVCVFNVTAQQHNVDTQKSTLTIHVGKTARSRHWDMSTKFTQRFTAVPQTPALILPSKYT